ncbi:MAG TPA: hypothetical protein VG204_09320 [Terriglobia bacterium]|nr:hypothetical protein [Terriglobia bacterium]
MKCPKRRWNEGLGSAPVKALLAIVLVTACGGYDPHAQDASPPSRPALIHAIKKLERSLGFRRTGNFKTHSETIAAYYRCYYTGKLDLPESYEGLELRQGTKDGCPVDPAQYDVFFYPIEAVGSGKSPVTASLDRDSLERFLVVVPHEDFHAGKGLRHLPATVTEASSTLIGFLTASEVARQQFGADAEVTRNLEQEPDLFLRKAELVNRYYTRLSEVYAAVKAGEVPASDALSQKARLFDAMQQQCQAIAPSPRSFNKCLAANNNAGLAFERTYTKYYPLTYQVFLAEGRNPKVTIEAIRKGLTAQPESEALERLQDLAGRE